MYSPFVLPGLADAQMQTNLEAYDQPTDQMVYGASSGLVPRAAFQTSEQAYNFESREIPVITSYSPRRGSNGTPICVYLEYSSDLLESASLAVSLMFADCQVPALLERLEAQANDVSYRFAVIGNAPPLSNTGSPSPRVDLLLHLQDPSGVDQGLLNVGNWLYDEGRQLELRASPEVTRKRKTTLETPDIAPTAKRVSPTYPQPTAPPEYASYTYTSNSPFAYPHSLHSIDVASMPRKLTPYGRSQSQQSLSNESPNMSVHNFSTDTGSTQSLMRPPLPQLSSYNSSYTTAQRSNRSPAPAYEISASSSPNPANPPLVRASKLQQQVGSTSTSAAPSSDGNFNPFTMYPHRAIISIQGRLDAMQDDWTPEERAAKRRLVRFRGEQVGSTINTHFKAVKPDERPSPHENRERRISCIYWEERDEYFVTSVDTIALLETLVGARFTVEEKNRIRRNLETHHPLTISKNKEDTESFFKVIMGFPNPKPRNIEKDVKVFPWPILTQALKKVISKYVSRVGWPVVLKTNVLKSASPASTAGPLPTSRSSKYSSAVVDTSSDRYTHLSSRSNTASSLGSPAYSRTLKSSTLSPPNMSHTLPTQYSQPSPLPMAITNAYTAPTYATQHPSADTQPPLGSTYSGQVSLPDLSHTDTASSVGRRRSSEAANTDFSSLGQYPTRPRANTSFSEIYQNTQQGLDFSQQMGQQLPSSAQAPRPSWMLGAYIQNEPGHMDNDEIQYRFPVRQDSNASQYHQQSTDLQTTQSTANEAIR